MSYTALKAAVEDATERDDYTDRWGWITNVAEAELNRDFRLLGSEKLVTINVTGGPVALPDDLLQIKALEGVIYQGEVNRNTQGCYYTFYGNGGIKYINVTADIGTGVRILYFAKTPSLAVQDTNALLTDQYDVVLWKFCEVAMIAVQEPEAANFYKGKYTEARFSTVKRDNMARDAGSEPAQRRAVFP